MLAPWRAPGRLSTSGPGCIAPRGGSLTLHRRENKSTLTNAPDRDQASSGGGEEAGDGDGQRKAMTGAALYGYNPARSDS
jgi:hypothetical protein